MRRMLISVLVLAFFCGLIKPVLAQEDEHNHKCFLDELVKQNIIKNPKALDNYYVYEENLKQLMKQFRENPKSFKAVTTDTLVNGRMIIPVVFHIIHNGGENNISKAQVLDAIEKINIDYSRTNADTSNTYSLFKSRAADMGVEFRLARIDPEGNCTDGIDRVYDERTDFAYFNVMSDNSWPYSKYMNVYSVSFIQPEGIELPAGAIIGGLSPLTPDNTLSGTGGDTLLDGVIIRHDCVGTIGTATDFGNYGMNINNRNRVFTHETGHFMNLYHPFQDLIGLLGGYTGCGYPIVLFGDTIGYMFGSNGDEVDDTPPVAQASQGCPSLTTNTCSREITGYGDEVDMVQNFMDYASGWCQNLFSTGQKERMNTTLMGTRRSLWSAENLHATGVLNPVALCPPIADFSATTYFVCPNDTVHFIDFSYNGEAEFWEWTFEGGTPATSTEQEPTIYYATPGTYQVKLKVTNAAGIDSIAKIDYIVVSDPNAAQDLPFLEDFETTWGPGNGWYLKNQDGNAWEVTDSAAYAGTKSLRIQNYVGNGAYSSDEFITPAVDMTTFVGTSPKFVWRLAYAGKRSIVNNPLTGTSDTTDKYDQLYVYMSTDCGNHWTQKYSKTGTSLATAGVMEASYVPAATTEWREEKFFLTNVVNNPNVRFKFKFISKGGNNLYLDNINIASGTSSVNLLNNPSFDVSIIPNPVTDESVLSLNIPEDHKVSIKIYNILGEEVANIVDNQLTAGIHKFNLQKHHFNSKNGMYFARIMIDNRLHSEKIVVNY